LTLANSGYDSWRWHGCELSSRGVALLCILFYNWRSLWFDFKLLCGVHVWEENLLGIGEFDVLICLFVAILSVWDYCWFRFGNVKRSYLERQVSAWQFSIGMAFVLCIVSIHSSLGSLAWRSFFKNLGLCDSRATHFGRNTVIHVNASIFVLIADMELQFYF